MKCAVASLLLLICYSTSARCALVTGFEDLGEFATYPAGSVIESNGLSFDVLPFFSPNGQFISATYGYLTPRQTMLLTTGHAGLDFELPINTNYIALDYRIGLNTTGLIVNGVATPFFTSFDHLDGTSIDGVLIEILKPRPVPFEGRLILSGEIDSFVIGGIQLAIDNVAIFVPEPSTMVLLLLGVSALAVRR